MKRLRTHSSWKLEYIHKPIENAITLTITSFNIRTLYAHVNDIEDGEGIMSAMIVYIQETHVNRLPSNN